MGGFSIPSSARLPTPKELESETGLQTYFTKTFASDEELLAELQARTEGIAFDSYGTFFEFLGDEGFTVPQVWTGRAGGSGLYTDPSEYYKKIAPGSAKPASSSTKKSSPKPVYADRAEELRATKPEIYEHYMDLDPFEKAGAIDAELLEIMTDPQAFSDYVAVQGLQDVFPQAVSGVMGVTSTEEFYDALYEKYDASGAPLMTYEEQTGFKTTEGAYNHLKAYEENLYQKGLDHVDGLLSRGDSGASNLNIKLFGVYLEAYLENPQDSMATYRALEGVLSHWNNPIGADGRANVSVLSGFYHDIVNNLSYAQKQELIKYYLSEGGADSPDQNPLLVGDIPKPLLNAISRLQKSVPVQMAGGFNKDVAETGDYSLLSALAWIDSRESFAKGPRKLFEDARELIVEAMYKSQVTLPPFAHSFYERIAHFPEGPARDKIYAEIGIKKEWVATAYSDLKWRVAQGYLTKGALGIYEAYNNPEDRPADCSTQEWKIACDIACSELNTTVTDAALMGVRFVCIIGLAVVGGMTGGVGGAIVAAAVGGGAGGALDVHDMAENLEQAQVNYYSDVDGTGVGSYQHVEVAQLELDYAAFCAAASTVATMATAGGTVAAGEVLKQVGMKGLALAMGNVAINGTVGMTDGTIMALSDGRIMDVKHNQEKMRLAGDEDGAKNYTPVTGVILSATLGGVIGGGFSTAGEALGGALKLLKPKGSGKSAGSRFSIRVDVSDPSQPPRISILAPDGNGSTVEVPTRIVLLDETTGRAVLELEDGTRLEANINNDRVHVEKARVKDADGDEPLELDADDDALAATARRRDDEDGLEELPLDNDDVVPMRMRAYEYDGEDLSAHLELESKGTPQKGSDPVARLGDDVPTLAAALDEGTETQRAEAPEGTPPPVLSRVASPATSSTRGRQFAQRDIRAIPDRAGLLTYTNGLISRVSMAREKGIIPEVAPWAADGPMTVSDYRIVEDTLETKLQQLAGGADSDAVTAVMKQIVELRLLAHNRSVPKPAAVETRVTKLTDFPAPLPESAAQVLNAANYKMVDEALEFLVPRLSVRAKEGQKVAQSTYEIYQTKLTALEQTINALEANGMDVRSLIKRLVFCAQQMESLKKFQVPDGTPLASPSAGPRADQSKSVVPVKRDRKELPPE